MSIVKVKGIPVELGGEALIVPPLSLGSLEQLQAGIAGFTGDVFDKAQIALVIDAALAALRRNYPEMTRERVAEFIDVANMPEVFEALMDVSGLKRKSMEAVTPGEALPG